ncbi:MAG TPA: TonB-dependent receptor [Gammaproteobacteria bacterium]|jgi:outer membrane receptor protein involved in Fe transport|nr:TonB-dependent receptor [Gammaproteobacteria bacterium]
MRRGFVLSGAYRAIPKVNVGGQYNYVHARFQRGMNDGKRIPLVSENLLRGNVSYSFSENFTFFVEGVYTGNQYPANDNANVAGKIGGYMIYNFNLRYQIKRLGVSLRMNNIFNKAYYFYTVYQASAGTAAEFFYPAPGRNVVLSANYSFGVE